MSVSCAVIGAMITFTPAQSFYLFCAYFICALPFGVILSLLVSKKDVRDQGSGNTGAANVSRLMGKKWGLIVLLLDALKGFLAVVLAFHFGDGTFANVVAMLAVFAHCYPIYLAFRGGKGVATGLGVMLALSPPLAGFAVAIFAAVFLSSRRTSAGSLAGALSIPLLVSSFPGKLQTPTAIFIAVLVWWKHRENIRRLLKREEPKFF